MDTNRDSAHQSQNEDYFPTFYLGLEFLNEAEKEKNNEKETRHQRRHDRFASLSEGEMQQILTERHSGKTKQMTNWSVSPGGGEGEGTPRKIGVGVQPASQSPYPIYDQNLRYFLPYLWPDHYIKILLK